MQIPGFIGGEAVTLEVSAELTANLAAQVGEATPGPAVPGLGPLGGLPLALALCTSVRLTESS